MSQALTRHPSRTHYFYSKHLGKTKQVDIYLPDQYNHRYQFPCVFMNDGQDAATMRVAEAAADLAAQKLIPPLIWVAVRADADRQQEYGVANRPDFAKRGSRAAAYTAFLTKELYPFVRSFYNTSPKTPNNAIMGMSLGGLSAFDIAWHYPHLFGNVGVFSGSFWWRRRDLADGYTPNDRIMQRVVAQAKHAPPIRAWLQVGTEDETNDRNNSGIIDSIEDTLDLIQLLRYKGMELNKNIRYVEIAKGRHDQATWAAALPDFLLWAFGNIEYGVWMKE